MCLHSTPPVKLPLKFGREESAAAVQALVGLLVLEPAVRRAKRTNRPLRTLGTVFAAAHRFQASTDKNKGSSLHEKIVSDSNAGWTGVCGAHAGSILGSMPPTAPRVLPASRSSAMTGGVSNLRLCFGTLPGHIVAEAACRRRRPATRLPLPRLAFADFRSEGPRHGRAATEG